MRDQKKENRLYDLNENEKEKDDIFEDTFWICLKLLNPFQHRVLYQYYCE